MPDGRINKCKACEAIGKKQYYEQNKGVLLAKAKEYVSRTRDQRSETHKRYYEKNKEIINAKNKAWREKNHDRLTAWHHNYYQENKAVFLEKFKAYRDSERGRAVMAKAHAKEKVIHAHKIKARYMVANALRDNRLKRGEQCQICGTAGKMQAHHHAGYDAENWLNVVWLCKPCHKLADKKQEL